MGILPFSMRPVNAYMRTILQSGFPLKINNATECIFCLLNSFITLYLGCTSIFFFSFILHGQSKIIRTTFKFTATKALVVHAEPSCHETLIFESRRSSHSRHRPGCFCSRMCVCTLKYKGTILEDG